MHDNRQWSRQSAIVRGHETVIAAGTQHACGKDVLRDELRLSERQLERLPPALVPSRTPLQGRYALAEPMNPAVHAAELYKAGHGVDATDHSVWDYLPYGPWASDQAYAAHLREFSAARDQIVYAVRPVRDGIAAAPGGQATFKDIDAIQGTIEIAYIWFGQDLKRTRAATEALFMMMCLVMDDLGYRRLQWRCNALNVASRNAARRLGFRFEGILYKHRVVKGRNRDTAGYSILDDEWPEVRGRIAAWLEPANFDADGVARTALSDAMSERAAVPPTTER